MTYFIGIDISKFKHDCFIMDENGEVIKDSFSFNNDSIGFNTLLDALSLLDPSKEKRIGFEATGHYGSNLKLFLDKNGYSYMEFNPLLVKREFSSKTLRRTKTDKVDARKLAIYLLSVSYKPNPNPSYHLECLKSLTRLRCSLVDERSLQLVRLTNVLDKMFPEFKPFFKSTGLKSATVQYLLTNYTTPSKMANMTRASFDKMKSELRNTISYSKFCNLKELAKNTIGNEDEILTFELRLILDIYKELNNKIEDIETKILFELNLLTCRTRTVVGIGDIMAASILAEVNNFYKFDSANRLLAFAGLEPSKDESGTEAHGGKMVKHGSPYLRRYIMSISNQIIVHNPVLYDYYRKKRNEGKSHTVALSHVAKKLVRIIYYLETNNKDFDITKVR